SLEMSNEVEDVGELAPPSDAACRRDTDHPVRFLAAERLRYLSGEIVDLVLPARGQVLDQQLRLILGPAHHRLPMGRHDHADLHGFSGGSRRAPPHGGTARALMRS